MLQQLKAAVQRSGERARNRRDYRALLALDDRSLRDIGVGRDEIRSMLSGSHYA